MATKVWVGGLGAVAQAQTLTVGGSASGSVYTVTIGGASVSYTATAADNTAAALGLQAALAASDYPQFQEVTWTQTGAVVTATGPSDGTPFTMAASVGGSGSPTLTPATATSPVSANDWSLAGNWSPSGVPVAADDVVIDNTDVPILYGLDQHTVTLTTLAIGAGFTGTIGLPQHNPKGYSEYRPDYLRIGATGAITVGPGIGPGSGRVKLDTGTVKATLNVLKTGNAAENGLESVLWKGTNNTSVITASGGSLGIAVLPGEVATVPSLGVGGGGGGQAPSVRCGPGVTLTTLTQFGGTAVIYAGVTTVKKFDGTLTAYGSGTGGTVNNDGGQLFWNALDITTLNVSQGGNVDMTGDTRTKTVGTCTLNAGAALAYEVATVTVTTLVLNRCSMKDVNLYTGTHCSVVVTVGP